MSNDDFPNIRVDQLDRPMRPSASNNGGPTPAPSASPVLASFALLIGLVGSGVAGYAVYQSMQLVKQNKAQEQRIITLENQLSATDDEIGQSTVALQSKVSQLANKTDELWSQMDKLWASAWRRNQSDIKDLDKTLSTLKADLTQLVKETKAVVDGMDKRVSKNNGDVRTLSAQVNGQKNDLLNVQFTLEELSSSTADYQQTNKALEDSLATLEQRNFSMLSRLNELEAKVTAQQKDTMSPQLPVTNSTANQSN